MQGVVNPEWLLAMGERPDKTGSNPTPVNPPRHSRPGSGHAVDGAQPMNHSVTLPNALQEESLLLTWVEAMQLRDQAALGKLYDATSARVYGVILRIVRLPELAEEVLADVYLQAWRDCHRYDPQRGKVIAWLLIIGRTRSLDALRRADEAFSHPTPHDLLNAEALADSSDNPAKVLEIFQEHTALRAGLDSLSAMQRQLIALAFFKGLSHAEIAAHTGLPLGSVKTHLRKGLAHLRAVLTENGDAE